MMKNILIPDIFEPYFFFCPDCNKAWIFNWAVNTRTTSCCPVCRKIYDSFKTKKEWVAAKTPNSIKFIGSLKR